MQDERTLATSGTVETQQARDPRKLAEALFKPKPPRTGENHPAEPVAATPQYVTRAPRILNVSQSVPNSRTRPNVSQPREKQELGIPQSAHNRIRTLATYGMTIRQVADLYDVDKSEIERIVGG